MKKIGGFLILLVLSGFALRQPPRITIWLCGDSTMSIKETKAYPETGWGMPFAFFWDSTVTVANRAKNGRSTKTFISEGLWQSVYDNIRPGDYVFIQFGHNDESKDKKERYATPDTFRMNLARFVNEARSKGGIPVLLTPVSRRKFDSSGTARPTHLEYAAYVQEVAANEKVVLFDLDTQSRELYQQMGKENSKSLFLQLQPGEHPNYPSGKEDNTHFNEWGARLIAQLVLRNIERQLPELASRTVKPKAK
jgi:lysophospholipase L1-like esterase